MKKPHQYYKTTHTRKWSQMHKCDRI